MKAIQITSFTTGYVAYAWEDVDPGLRPMYDIDFNEVEGEQLVNGEDHPCDHGPWHSEWDWDVEPFFNLLRCSYPEARIYLIRDEAPGQVETHEPVV